MFFLLILAAFPISLLILSIIYKKIGGVISVVGGVSLFLSSFKLFWADYILERLLATVNFFKIYNRVSSTVSVAEVAQPAVDPDLIWFIASIVVFVVGLVWLAIELINVRKTKNQQ